MPIGQRRNALSTHRVGGMAFPNDYNWTCNICLRENRAFEETCTYCEHDARAIDTRLADKSN